MKTMQNAVTLSGNLGAPVAITQLGSGKRVARVAIATNEFFTDPSGTSQKRTQWHNLVAWDDTADRMQRHLTKGTFVVIHGKLVNRRYLDRNGNTQTLSEVVVREFSWMRPMIHDTQSAA